MVTAVGMVTTVVMVRVAVVGMLVVVVAMDDGNAHDNGW